MVSSVAQTFATPLRIPFFFLVHAGAIGNGGIGRWRNESYFRGVVSNYYVLVVAPCSFTLLSFLKQKNGVTYCGTPFYKLG